MYTISPEFGSSSGAAMPPVKEISERTAFWEVSTVPEAVEVEPTTAFEALDSNANTLPPSVSVEAD